MWLLAIEWSSSRRSVALINPEPTTDETKALARGIEKDASPTSLIQELLETHSVSPEAISSIALGIGPGSYTGIRSAIGFSLGWVTAREIPILPIRSDRALAYRFRLNKKPEASPVFFASYAQQETFAVAGFSIENGRLVEPFPLGLKSISELEALIKKQEAIYGVDLGKRCPEAKPIHPQAEDIGRLAFVEGDPISPESIKPIYLRETQFKKAPPPRDIPGIDS